MNDLISATLRENADGDVHVERLLSAVHDVARRRRRATRSVLAVTVAMTLIGGTAGVRWLSASRGPAVVPGPAATAPRPPLAVNQPLAADSALELGVDPTLFHLDLTDGPDAWTSLAWASQPGYEELTGTTMTSHDVRIAAARDEAGLPWRDGPRFDLSVAGQPAQAIAADGLYAVRWQPVAGIWAQAEIESDDVRLAIDLAQRVRLDRVYRCAVPFRLPGLTSPRLTKCSTNFVLDGHLGIADWSATGSAWFTLDAGGPEYQVSVGRAELVTPNDSAGGRAIQFVQLPGGPASMQIRYGYEGRTAYFWVFGGTDKQSLVALASAFTPVAGTDPDGWPSTPFE